MALGMYFGDIISQIARMGRHGKRLSADEIWLVEADIPVSRGAEEDVRSIAEELTQELRESNAFVGPFVVIVRVSGKVGMLMGRHGDCEIKRKQLQRMLEEEQDRIRSSQEAVCFFPREELFLEGHKNLMANMETVTRFHIGEGDVVGRLPTAGRQEFPPLKDDLSVSRTHAQFFIENGGEWILENRSPNGSFINESSVDRGVIKNGDVLKFGNTRFVAVLEPPISVPGTHAINAIIDDGAQSNSDNANDSGAALATEVIRHDTEAIDYSDIGDSESTDTLEYPIQVFDELADQSKESSESERSVSKVAADGTPEGTVLVDTYKLPRP